MNRSFGAREEARPDPRARGTESHRGGEAASISDAASGKNGDRRNAVDNRRDERHRGDRALYVTAGLPALRNDRVGTVVDRDSRGIGAWHRVQHFRAAAMRRHGQRARLTPEKRNDRNAFGNANRKSLVLRLGQNKVDAERPASQRSCRADFGAYLVGWAPAESERAEATRIADGRGKLWTRCSAH